MGWYRGGRRRRAGWRVGFDESHAPMAWPVFLKAFSVAHQLQATGAFQLADARMKLPFQAARIVAPRQAEVVPTEFLQIELLVPASSGGCNNHELADGTGHSLVLARSSYGEAVPACLGSEPRSWWISGWIGSV